MPLEPHFEREAITTNLSKARHLHSSYVKRGDRRRFMQRQWTDSTLGMH